MKLWQIKGEEHAYDWFSVTPDPDERQAMFDWIAIELSVDPAGAAHAWKDRGDGRPLYTTDVDGTNAFVDFLIIEEYHTVMILDVSDVDLRNP